MKDEILAKRYTQALFSLCEETKTTVSVQGDLEGIYGVFKKSSLLSNFLKNKAISRDNRKEIVNTVFKGKVQAITLDFLLLLEEKHRLALLEPVCILFKNLALKAQNIERVTITSNAALTKPQVAELSEHLHRRLKKNIEPVLKVDPELIGGIKIQIGDTIEDYSIRAQLNAFKESLIHASA